MSATCEILLWMLFFAAVAIAPIVWSRIRWEYDKRMGHGRNYPGE